MRWQLSLLSIECSLVLLAKVRAHHREIVLSQAADDFLLKIVTAGGHGVAVSLLERAAALLDIFLQPIVKILVPSSLRNLGLVVELDFVHKQAGEALCLAVGVCVLSRESCKRIRRRSGGRTG